jgi:hypothetical protein
MMTCSKLGAHLAQFRLVQPARRQRRWPEGARTVTVTTESRLWSDRLRRRPIDQSSQQALHPDIDVSAIIVQLATHRSTLCTKRL